MRNAKNNKDIQVVDNSDVKEIKRTGRGGKYNFPSNAEPEEAGVAARYVRYAAVSLDLPPIDISDPEQIKQRAKEYFNFCAENDRKPQWTGLANWLGVSRDTLNSWENGEYRGSTHSDLIKRIKSIIEEIIVECGNNGDIQQVFAIFQLKAQHGWRDQQELVLIPQSPLDNVPQAEEIATKYAELPSD